MKRAAFTLLALLLVLAGCGGGSSSKPKRREVILTTEAADEKAGKEAASQVAGQMGIVTDTRLSIFVNQLGNRLVRYAPRRNFDYTFQIIDQDAPNAFALPGGHIYVSRGLLTLTNSEDELAGVLGHEIVHVAARHAAARQAVTKSLGPFQMFAYGSIAAYGRDQEREADRLGQGLCAVAGYDPGGIATFLKDLEYTERLRLGGSRYPYFLDTHPTTQERVSGAASRAKITRWERQPGITTDPVDYLRRLEGLVIGTSAREGVFRGDLFVHPEFGFAMRFPGGWETRNTHAAVGAMSPERNAQVFLEHGGSGDDPQLASVEFLKKAQEQGGFRIETAQPVDLGEFRAFRVTGRSGSPRGPTQVMITWIAKDGVVYRITGAATGRSENRYAGTFINVARSFRALKPKERASVRETRLAIVTARENENLEQLTRRTGNKWNIQQTAVWNDLFANVRLEQGQVVKIAVSKLYKP